jgi:YD repeat-containing protein
LTVTETREGETAPGDLLTVASETRTVTVNGLPFTRTYDGATRTLVETTPEGRTRTIELDPQGRVAATQVTGLAPVTFGRDATGLLRTITAGTGPSARVTLLDYDARRRLETITDPLARPTTFGYDDADRVTSQELPDEEVVLFGYDASGNVRSVTPPIRPAHTFDYTPVDLEELYTPPAVGGPVARWPRRTTTPRPPARDDHPPRRRDGGVHLRADDRPAPDAHDEHGQPHVRL